MTIRSMTVTDSRDTTKTCCKRPIKLKMKVLLGVILLLVIVLAICGFVIGLPGKARRWEPPDPVLPQKPSASPLHMFRHAAVCSDAPPCSEIGSFILSHNGSAVDAAIATMFCTGVMNQQSMGLGGGFFMTVYIKEKKTAYAVSAREAAPHAASKEMFHGVPAKATKGPLAVGVPGELRGMWAAHQRWGKLPWSSLVEPTLQFCETGAKVSKIKYDSFFTAPYIKNDPLLRKQYVDPLTNEFYKPGTVVKPSEPFCNTLRVIADRGGDELYNGSLRDTVSVQAALTAYHGYVAIRKLWFQQTIKEAVDEPRIHHQVYPMEIQYQFGVIEDIVKGLKEKGHCMKRYLGRGSTICTLFRNGTAIYGNADFRKGGDVSGH